MHSWWGRIAPFPKLHLSIIESLPRASVEEEHPKTPWWAASRPLCKTEAQQSAVAGSWRTGQCTAQADAVTTGVLHLGRWCLGLKQTPFSPRQTESALIFTATCSEGPSSHLCCSGLGTPAWGKTPHSCGEGILQLRYSSGFLATAHGCQGQPFPCLCFSYQSLYSFF